MSFISLSYFYLLNNFTNFFIDLAIGKAKLTKGEVVINFFGCFL